MSRITSGNRMLGLVVTSALTGVLLSGCASSGAEPANISAGRAEGALASGNADKAIRHAEAAVLAEPRLSCRSGGSARFVAGGELPIPVIGHIEKGALILDFRCLDAETAFVEQLEKLVILQGDREAEP